MQVNENNGSEENEWRITSTHTQQRRTAGAYKCFWNIIKENKWHCISSFAATTLCTPVRASERERMKNAF